MLLAFIFSILTATYSLSSTTSVEASGVLPEGSTYTYERSASTGQKGQMTAGNSTRLYLTGWEGCTIRTVTLSMRSNKSAGAGSLRMSVGDRVVWQIDNQSFSDAQWAGCFSTEWIDVEKIIDVSVNPSEPIELVISATENSLYINRYSIDYEAPAPECYTVEFVTGLHTAIPPITQTSIGGSILLPACQDTAIWHFLGWSESEVQDAYDCPLLFSPNTSYLPVRDTRLYAVYSTVDEVLASIGGVSGEYVLSQRTKYIETVYGPGVGAALCDGVDAYDLVPTCSLELGAAADGTCCMLGNPPQNAVYELNFTSDSTLTILHPTYGYIGYKQNRLANEMAEWHYRVLDDGSLAIYYSFDKEDFALYMGAGYTSLENGVVGFVRPLAIDQWHNDGIWLFPILHAQYTTWPFGKFDAIDTVEADVPTAPYHLQWGVYDMYVVEGKKYLRLK